MGPRSPNWSSPSREGAGLPGRGKGSTGEVQGWGKRDGEWQKGCSVLGLSLEGSVVRRGWRGVRAVGEVGGMSAWAEKD